MEMKNNNVGVLKVAVGRQYLHSVLVCLYAPTDPPLFRFLRFSLSLFRLCVSSLSRSKQWPPPRFTLVTRKQKTWWDLLTAQIPWSVKGGFHRTYTSNLVSWLAPLSGCINHHRRASPCHVFRVTKAFIQLQTCWIDLGCLISFSTNDPYNIAKPFQKKPCHFRLATLDAAEHLCPQAVPDESELYVRLTYG